MMMSGEEQFKRVPEYPEYGTRRDGPHITFHSFTAYRLPACWVAVYAINLSSRPQGRPALRFRLQDIVDGELIEGRP